MVKPSRARMRSAVLLGSLLALLPALPALAADPTPATEAPGPLLRAGSLMLIPAPATVQRGIGAYGDAAALAVLHGSGRGNQHQAAGTQLRTRCFSGRRGISGECGQCRQQGEQAAQQH